MNQAWSETSVNNSGNLGVIGMFGQDDKYYFYFQFSPAADDKWYDGATTSKKFRLLF